MTLVQTTRLAKATNPRVKHTLSHTNTSWLVQVFPDGDYYVFTSPDLRFSTFGHPWEATICVWGAELIDAVEAHNTGILTRLYRRDGQRSDHQ